MGEATEGKDLGRLLSQRCALLKSSVVVCLVGQNATWGTRGVRDRVPGS